MCVAHLHWNIHCSLFLLLTYYSPLQTLLLYLLKNPLCKMVGLPENHWESTLAWRRYEFISHGQMRSAFNLKKKNPLVWLCCWKRSWSVRYLPVSFTCPWHVMAFPSIFSHWLSHSKHTEPLANSRISLKGIKKKKSVRVAYIIDLSVCISILKYWSRPCRGRFWSVWCFYVHRISLLILNQQVGKAKAKLNFKYVQTALKHVRRNVLC